MDFSEDPQWEHVHPIVGHLLRQHHLEPRGLRGFAVLPRLDLLGNAKVAVWMAEHGRPWVTESRRESYDATLQRVRELVALETRAFWVLGDPDRRDEEIDLLNTRKTARRAAQALAAKKRPPGVDALALASAGAITAASYSVLQVLQAMAARLGAAVGDDAVPALARELEDVILRTECQSAADAYLRRQVDVRRVLWRGPTGTKPAGHFLFSTDDGFGVVTKLRNRWSATVGERDEVLATLPDSWFPEAVAGFFELAGDNAPERHSVFEQSPLP